MKATLVKADGTREELECVAVHAPELLVGALEVPTQHRPAFAQWIEKIYGVQVVRVENWIWNGSDFVDEATGQPVEVHDVE